MTIIVKFIAIFLFTSGLCVTINTSHLLKKIIFLNLSQVGIILLFILGGYKGEKSLSPFLINDNNLNDIVYVDPTPQALMLTAIVVGLVTNAVALSIIMKLKKCFGTVDDLTIESVIRSDSSYNIKTEDSDKYE